MADRVNASDKLYNRIAVLRAERGLGRNELAKALRVSYQTIGFMERSEYNRQPGTGVPGRGVLRPPRGSDLRRVPFRPMSEELYSEKPGKEKPK